MADLGADVTAMLDNVESTVRAIAQKFGFTDVGGVRKTDPYPDHPGGYAADYMTQSRAQGDTLANWSTVNAEAIGLDYQIWYGRVWDVDKDPIGLPWAQWRAYSGSNPHTDHVHQTYRKNAVARMVDGLGTGLQTVAAKLFDVDAFMKQVHGTSVTLLAAGLGVVLLGIGISMSVRSTIASHAKKVMG
jgi:hypothetical protein